MADNTILNAGTGGDTIRDIDKGGKKTQVVTLDLGGAGAESLVNGSLPVTGAFYQATQPVSGNVNISDGVNAASITTRNEQLVAYKDFAPATTNITAQDVAIHSLIQFRFFTRGRP